MQINSLRENPKIISYAIGRVITADLAHSFNPTPFYYFEQSLEIGCI
jgi:hypothetical protein